MMSWRFFPSCYHLKINKIDINIKHKPQKTHLKLILNYKLSAQRDLDGGRQRSRFTLLSPSHVARVPNARDHLSCAGAEIMTRITRHKLKKKLIEVSLPMIGHIRNGMGANPATCTDQLQHILVFESILPKHGAKLEDNL